MNQVDKQECGKKTRRISINHTQLRCFKLLNSILLTFLWETYYKHKQCCLLFCILVWCHIFLNPFYSEMLCHKSDLKNVLSLKVANRLKLKRLWCSDFLWISERLTFYREFDRFLSELLVARNRSSVSNDSVRPL